MDKSWYEGKIAHEQRSWQMWTDLADEANITAAGRARRMEYAAASISAAAKIVDEADRKGLVLDVSLQAQALPVTRIKLKEEIRLLLERCEAADREVTRVNAACAEIDADAEGHALRMERMSVVCALVTFILGIALGMMF